MADSNRKPEIHSQMRPELILTVTTPTEDVKAFSESTVDLETLSHVDSVCDLGEHSPKTPTTTPTTTTNELLTPPSQVTGKWSRSYGIDDVPMTPHHHHHHHYHEIHERCPGLTSRATSPCPPPYGDVFRNAEIVPSSNQESNLSDQRRSRWTRSPTPVSRLHGRSKDRRDIKAPKTDGTLCWSSEDYKHRILMDWLERH